MIPNVTTYTALISACEKGEQPELALEIAEEMQRHDVIPNVITYRALISACENGKQPERALRKIALTHMILLRSAFSKVLE